MRRAAILFLVLAACSPLPRRGATVVLASGADLQSPNPLLTTHPLARQVQRYVLLVTLVRRDSALAIEPYFARGWKWSNDRTRATLALHSGLRWHDGRPTTAHDAAWTLEAARRAETGYPRRAELADLAAARAEDDSTLVLEFASPQAELPDVLTDLALLPRHRLDSLPLDRLREAAWNRRPVGNGPFRFADWEPNRRWVFEANPDFPASLGGPPRLARLVVAVVDEPTTKLAALTAGELDLAGINPAHAEFVRNNPRLTVVEYPLLFSYAVVFNLRRPPFQDPAARRAVAAAVEPGALVEGVLFGFGTPAEGALPPELGRAASADVRAAATPARPGAGPQPPGPRSSLDFELLTVGSGEAALEQMLQAQLARQGIRARIRQIELSTFLDRVYGAAREFEAAVMGIPGDLAGAHLAALAELSGLRPGGSREQLPALLADSAAAVFLYHARGVQGMNRRVRGVTMDLRGELATVTGWHVDDR